MAKAGAFKAETDKLYDQVARLFNRAITAGMLKGLDAAVRATKHDSSNAAAHWMIAGADGRSSRPWQRKLGKLQYMRGSSARPPIYPVGYRNDHGKNESATVKFVHQRELAQVLKELVAGRRPEFRFYFYNAVGEVEKYAANAGIDAAGQAAVETLAAEAEKQILIGNTRKVTLT